MTIRNILIAPDKKLKQRSTPVEAVDDDIRTLAADMLETMYAADGLGLAAIQVGVAKRIIVTDIHGKDEPPNPLHMINPEIIWNGDDRIIHEEGCLSLPDHYAEVERPNTVRFRFLDLEGEIREMEAEGIQAVCLQHEMDHLEGILFVDHISMIKRSMILRKLTKLRRIEGDAFGQPQTAKAASG